MATLKQKRALKLVETGRNMGEVMRLAGYSPSTATHPKKLTESKSWQKQMDKFLPDKKLLQVHNELLENPDWRARDAGLEKAYRIKGKLVNSSPNGQETVSQEIREVIFRIRDILPSEAN